MKILKRMSDYEIGISKKELTILLKKLSPQEIEELIERTPAYEETIEIIESLVIWDSKIEFENGEVCQISYCRKCRSTKYRLKPMGECDVCICAECGNDSWD